MPKLHPHIYEQIEVAINHQNIIAVDNGDEYMFFTAPSIETSSTSNIGSTDFNEFKGVNVTEYFTRNKIVDGTRPQHYLENFMNHVKDKQSVSVKLNKTLNYILFCR